MNILAIDPGTNCGWAIRWSGGGMMSGVWDLQPRRHEGAGMRFVKFRTSFKEMVDIAKTPKLIVVYEEVRRHLGTDAAHIHGGIVAQIQVVCEERGVPYTAIPVGTIKKHATGKGNADKESMVAAANLRWTDASITDDNEADARWLAEAAFAQFGDKKGETT